MDSLIPSINIPGLGNYASDGSLTIQIENPPPELQKLGLGENIRLELLPSGGQADLSKLQAVIKGVTSQVLLDIPVSLSGLKNAGLSDNQIQEISARLVSKNPQAFELKILTINNERPENFVSRPIPPDGTPADAMGKASAGPVRNNLSSGTVVQSAENAKNPAVSDGILIGNNNNSLFSLVKMLPVKLGTALENIFVQNQIPQNTASALAENLNRFSLQIAIAPLQPSGGQNVPASSNAALPETLRQIVSLVKNNLPADGGALPENIIQKMTTEIIGVLSSSDKLTLPAEMLKADGKLWPVLQSPLGQLVPETSLKIPEDAKILLQIVGLLQNNGTDISKLTPPGLKDIFELLQNKEMPDMEGRLLEKIPQNNGKMLANIISFVKAARSGNAEHWLGTDNVNRLNAAGTDGKEVLEKLNTVLNAQVQENAGWKIINIPFYGDNIFNRIRIAVKKMEDEEQQRQEKRRKEKSAVRFVVDTSFSVLGAFQLDGFSFTKDKRFDLIVRTEKDMERDFCSEMMRLFQKSLEEVGYSGNMKINVKENFIKICETDNRDATLEDGIFI